MARPPKVHYEDVARACVRLIGRGKAPTTDAIYEEVGRQGSRSTIHKHQKAFLEKFEEAGLSMLPAALPEALIPAIEEFWSVALLEAGKSYQKFEEEHENKVYDLEVLVRSLKEQIQEREKALEDRQRELRHAYDEKVALAEADKELRSEIRGLEAVIEALRNDKDRLHQQLSDERAAADRRYDLAAQDWIAERKAFEDAIEEIKARARESEATYDRLTNYWAQQVDDARQQVSEIKQRMAEESNRYASDLSLERARSARMSQDLDRLREQLQKQESKLEDRETELDGVKGELLEAREEKRCADEVVDELSRDLEDCQKELAELRAKVPMDDGSSDS